MGLADMIAAECLEMVSRRTSEDATLLHACVLEAQNAGDKRQAIQALEKVLQRFDHSTPSGVHLPALMRYSFNSFLCGGNTDFFSVLS